MFYPHQEVSLFPTKHIPAHSYFSEKTVFEVTKGSEFTTSVTKQEAELTKEMIESGQWKNANFKPYNFKSKVSLKKVLESYTVNLSSTYSIPDDVL